MVKRKADDSDAAAALEMASAAAEAALLASAPAAAESQSGSVTVGAAAPATGAATATNAAAGAPDDMPMPALNVAGAGGATAVPRDAAATDLIIAEAAAAAALRQEEAERVAAAAMASGTADLQPKKRARMTWLDRLEQLKEFKAQFGHCNVNIRYKANPTLGKWCNNMREQYKLYCRKTKLEQEGKEAEAKQLPRCPMNAERVRLLEEVGFQWSTNRIGGFDEAWDRRLEELKQYKQANGNCDVPNGYKENPKLAEWVHRQRCQYVSMKDREKTGETIAEQKLRVHLEHQQKKKGKSVTPSPTVAAVVARSKKDPNRNNVMEETIRKRMTILEKMGFQFKVKDNIWMQRLQELKDYKAEHGDCGVPITYPPNPILGRWVHTQRHQEKLRRESRTDAKKSSKSTMTDERFALLDAIGFNWEVRAGTKGGVMKPPHLYSWEDRFEELRGFYQTTGHCIVPADHNPYLNEWCSEQKELLMTLQVDPNDSMARARMTDEQVQRLASVGFTSATDVPPPHAEYAAVAAIAAPVEQHHHPMGHEAAVAAAVAAAEGDHLPEMGQSESQQV